MAKSAAKRPSRSKAATAARRAADQDAGKTATDQTSNDRANAANGVENPAGSGIKEGGSFPTADREVPLSKEERLKTPEEERIENNPQGTRMDGTTARHTEPLGPPAPGQRGVPGPERRVVPQTGMSQGGPVQVTGPDGERVFNTDTDEGLAEYRNALGPVMRVKATKMGHIHNVRRRAGDVFDVREKEFSPRWMERVDGKTPPKQTTSKQALAAASDDAFEKTNGVARAGASRRSSGDREAGQ
jgi:hypothetical protein